jgi:predicted MPP superfamily phosphohydrolase
MKASILLFILAFTAFYGGASFYVGLRIYQGLAPLLPQIHIAFYAGVFGIIVLSLFAAFTPLPVAVKRTLTWIGVYWLGAFVYLLLLFLLADAALFFAALVNAVPAPLPQSIRFYAAAIVISLTAVIFAFGRYNASQIRHAHYDIPAGTAAFAETVKIILISDLHLGAVNSEKNLARIVQKINKLDADLVCVAGDIFNDTLEFIRDRGKLSEQFRSINSKYGVYACLGNHDGGEDFGEIQRLLEQGNVRLLKDEYIIINKRFVLIGRLDSSPIGGFGGLKRKKIADVLSSANADLPASLPIIVMDHNPANAREYGKQVSLILSGHTHKGQLFPVNLITRAIFASDYGYYKKDAESPGVVTTSGAGTWGMPLRVGSNNEVVSISWR